MFLDFIDDCVKGTIKAIDEDLVQPGMEMVDEVATGTVEMIEELVTPDKK